MAYITNAELTDRNGQTYTTTSKPSTATVTDIIAEASAEIDGKLRGIYSLPIAATATESLTLLKRICMLLVRGEIEDIQKSSTRTDVEDKDGQRINSKIAQARKLLKEIKEKTLVLTDATEASATGGVGYSEKFTDDNIVSAELEDLNDNFNTEKW